MPAFEVVSQLAVVGRQPTVDLLPRIGLCVTHPSGDHRQAAHDAWPKPVAGHRGLVARALPN